MNNKIFCIGDSHVSVFLGKDHIAPLYPEKAVSQFPFMDVTRLGPVTAYNFCEITSTTKAREKFETILTGLPPASWLLISAGEIDCRVHLVKQANAQKKTFEEIAEILASRFLSYLGSIQALGFRICLLLPPPTKFIEQETPEYPSFGTEIERNQVTRTLTRKLEAECAVMRIPTIGIFEKAVTGQLQTKKEYLWDGIHLATLALPDLVAQLKTATGMNLKIPKAWVIREKLRTIKRKIG
jgi:hypothetical protein